VRLSIAAFAAAFFVLCAHTRRFLPFLSDDALISLRYAKRLAEGGGLTWNAGERVEGYSNLLWVLCSAALGWLGFDLVDAVRVLGFLGMGATLAAILYAHPPRSVRAAPVMLLVLLFLSLAAPFAIWTVGGMEQPMVAGLLAWAVVLCYPRLERRGASFREMLLPGFLFALLCWTRLDGPVFVAATVAAIFLIDGVTSDSFRKSLGIALLPVLFCLLQLGFRLAYYGEWIPNTALVKFVPSGKHTLDGWGYLRAGAFAILPLIALAATSVVMSFVKRGMRPRLIFLLVLIVSWAAYVIAIGGDIFPGWRHFIPLLVLLVLTVAIGAEWIAEHASPRVYLASFVSGALCLLIFLAFQFRDEENFRAISERWEWDGEVVGTLLKKAFREEQPLMAVDPAGCLPFWSELPSLDMLGLNDYHLPRHPPPDFGQGAIGHELGDGKYVLDRKPDLVVFLLPTGSEHAYFLSGKLMQKDPRFYRDYTLVRFEGSEPYTVRSNIWVRRASERIGIKSTPDAVEIPGFLFNDNPASVARLGGDARLVVSVRPNAPAVIREIELTPGRWRIEVDPTDRSLKVRVLSTVDGSVIAEGTSPLEFALTDEADPRKVNFELVSTNDTAEVRRLVLRRQR
jgi:hypothetical protein